MRSVPCAHLGERTSEKFMVASNVKHAVCSVCVYNMDRARGEEWTGLNVDRGSILVN